MLEFLLTKNTLLCNVEKGKEDWVLAPDVAFQRNHQRFDVLLGSKVYDGFGLRCTIRIKQRTPQNIAWAEELARLAQKASGGKMNANAVSECVGTIALVGWTKDAPPQFEIIVLVSTDAFFRVQKSLERHACHMSLVTDPFEAGLVHGDDPDGNELRWHVNRVEVAIVESMSLQFRSPRPGNANHPLPDHP